MSQFNLVQTTDAAIPTPTLASSLAHYEDANLILSSKDTAGIVRKYRQGLKNGAVSSVTGYAADTYLVGSSIPLPSGIPLANSTYHTLFDVTKTGAGVAAAVLTLRFGTLGTTGDAALCVFTFGAQTAVIDTGVFEVWATFRTVGAGTSAVVQGLAMLTHNLQITGLDSTGPMNFHLLPVTSSGFNSTVAASIIGLSVNGGASAAWTTTLVQTDFNI